MEKAMNNSIDDKRNYATPQLNTDCNNKVLKEYKTKRGFIKM